MKDVTGVTLVEKLNLFRTEFNLFKLERKILECNNVSEVHNIENVQKIGIGHKIEQIKNEGLPLYDHKYDSRGLPKFLSKHISKGRNNIAVRFLYLSEMLKKDDPNKLNIGEDFLLDGYPCNFYWIIRYKRSIIKELRRLLDSRFLFFDSSIWYRYVSIKDIESIAKLKTDLETYWKLGLYSLPASNEFYNFQKRLFENSYIKPEGIQPSHGGMVTPFTFHSETQMEIMAEKLKEDIFNDLKDVGSWNWDILFFDDESDLQKVK